MRTTKLFLIIALVFCQFPLLLSQSSIDNVLMAVEENNLKLKALREFTNARKIENKTGISLSDPDIDFGYLWGSPGEVGHRKDISAMQSFDIATVFGYKSRLANDRNISLELQFKAERIKILLDAKMLCLDLIYYNSMIREVSLRLSHIQSIADVYERRLESGDVSWLEYNKAKFNLVNFQAELLLLENERKALLAELKRYNGGEDIELEDDHFEPVSLPTSFDDWYIHAGQKDPVIAYIKQEVEVSKRLLNLNRISNLPEFSAGYLSEKVTGEHFQGVQVGLTIPLWANKNRISQAKASILAAEANQADGVLQFYNELNKQYERASRLWEINQKYLDLLDTTYSIGLLKKALDEGEISLLDYLTELQMYYEAVNIALKTERDYQKAVADLMSVDL